ncbi:hypothetical protein DH2020_033025 [Rehmannia glutinosa]|uniref:Uncharacterized protein n=1 Tax=Rehmannia glutinosa TaxID=99300 RepID=A0ABR0VGB6_REHGL
MAQKVQQQLKELGSKLESPPASKDALIKLLKQSAACLTELDQSPPKSVMDSMQPLLNAIAKPELLKHHDREVKLFVASCICEITRITAPEAPYDDHVLKDIFELIVGTFSGLSDINGPSFGRRVVILETVARYRSCVVMLDLECDDLINEMFNTFFAVAREEHPGNVLTSMQTIMEVLLEECEDVPENLLLILLSILGRDKEGVTMAARRLAMNVIENCAAKLEPSIKQFIVSSMSGDSRPLKSEINYHAVLYDIYRCAPQILSGVVPYLTGELLLLVKRYSMERLADIYRISCMKRSSDSTKDDEYDWIVGKILRCFYDKDFRSDTIEPVLSLSLFPADFSIKDKVTKWVRIFSAFDKVEVKALEKILEQKQRILYEGFSDFVNPLQDDLLNILGQKHRLYEFLSTLSLKCSYLLFDKDHVRGILLDVRAHKSSGSTELILSCMTILVVLARFCPLLLGGTEEDLVHLLEDDNEIIKEGTLHILARAGGTIREQLGVSSRSLDLILERISIEGSRRQAKYAVHALASVTKDDGLKSLSVLYKRLVDMLEERSHLPAVLQSLGCIAQAAMPIFETRESEVQKFIKENILELGHIFGVKALVKSYLPVKDAHLRSGIDDIIEILKKILVFGDISKDIESSLVDRAHLKLAAAKAVLRLSKQWEHKIPVDVLYLTLRTSEDNFPEVKKLLLSKVHQYVRDRILDSKYACAFLLDVSSSLSDFEENKRYLNDIIQMCRQGRGRQTSLQTDAMSPSLYPEYILPYVVHSLAHHPSFPNIDECKDVKSFEPMYRQLYLFLSMLVHGDADGKSDVSISKDKESITLLNSTFQSIKRAEDAFDPAKSKRLAPNQDELQDSSAPVALPPLLYKPLEKKEENDSLVGEEKTWLADEGILAHFESLELEANGIVHSVISEDDIMKDSETEGSEMPLGKLMKRLKAKAAKTKKEAKNEPAQAGVANENDFDILKMVKEINSEGATSKIKSSNGHKHARKKRSQPKLQKSQRLFDETTDVPVPKRRRTSSAQAHKSPEGVSSKGSRKPTNVNQENSNIDIDKMDEEPQTSSENQYTQEKTVESAEPELLFSRIRKKYSSSKQKGRRTDRDQGEALSISRKLRYYEGVVKSFDTEKKKHVVLYDDGDVEVLKLDKERWELVEKDLKFKIIREGKEISGGPKQGKNWKRKKEENERIEKSLATEEPSDKDNEQDEDFEKELSDADEPKEEDKDFEDTESDLGGSPHDAHGSDNEAVSSSDKQHPNDTKEESGQETDEADNIDKPDEKTSSSDSVDTEFSDDEPLGEKKLPTNTWKPAISSETRCGTQSEMLYKSYARDGDPHACRQKAPRWITVISTWSDLKVLDGGIVPTSGTHSGLCVTGKTIEMMPRGEFGQRRMWRLAFG